MISSTLIIKVRGVCFFSRVRLVADVCSDWIQLEVVLHFMRAS